jgi:hypothetical protein
MYHCQLEAAAFIRAALIFAIPFSTYALTNQARMPTIES